MVKILLNLWVTMVVQAVDKGSKIFVMIFLLPLSVRPGYRYSLAIMSHIGIMRDHYQRNVLFDVQIG